VRDFFQRRPLGLLRKKWWLMDAILSLMLFWKGEDARKGSFWLPLAKRQPLLT
jgi:hypothetical protein